MDKSTSQNKDVEDSYLSHLKSCKDAVKKSQETVERFEKHVALDKERRLKALEELERLSKLIKEATYELNQVMKVEEPVNTEVGKE